MKDLLSICIPLMFVGFLSSCEEETFPEARQVEKVTPQKTEAYYANLRAYKESDHQVFFAWFGGTGGEGSPDEITVYDHIPDSVDMVSLWGGIPEKDSHKAFQLHEIQHLKNTEFFMVSFSNDVFLNHWSGEEDFEAVYNTGHDEKLLEGFHHIAQKLQDSISYHGLDGLDLDHEPRLCGCDWGLFEDNEKWNTFLIVLSEYLGPLSGTHLKLKVDGEYSMISEEASGGLDYIVTQAYSSSSPGSLDRRRSRLPPNFPPEKFIVTENFESFWSDGGVNYNHPELGTIPSLLGMAYWQPKDGIKGGAGAYHAEYEYQTNPDYKYIRKAIQIMNPAVK